MKTTVTRRRFLGSASAVGLAVGAPYVVRAAEPIRLRAPGLASGFSAVISNYLAAKRTDLKNGLDIDYAVTYTSVRNLYNDFVAGNLDISAGTWDSFAHRYLKGVPAELACIITTGQMAGMFTGPDGPRTLEDLRGKTLAAMQVSGTYRLTKLILESYSGMKLEKDIEVQNAPNPVATLSLVMAKRADAALTWEPSLSLGLKKLPGSRVFFNVGEYYKSHAGRVFPYMCLALRSDTVARHPDLPKRVIATYGELFELMGNNLEEAATLTAAKTKMSVPVLMEAFNSGRMRFEMRSMGDAEHRADVQALADYMTGRGVFKRKVDAGFYSKFS